MGLFEKIEKIRIENRLGVADFLDKTGFSKTSYYAVKDGKSTSLTLKSAEKIVSISDNYDVEWLLNDYVFLPNSTNGVKKIVKSDLSDLEVKEIVYKVATNEERFMQEKVFSNIIEIRVAKRLQKIMSSEEEYIKWRNN